MFFYLSIITTYNRWIDTLFRSDNYFPLIDVRPSICNRYFPIASLKLSLVNVTMSPIREMRGEVTGAVDSTIDSVEKASCRSGRRFGGSILRKIRFMNTRRNPLPGFLQARNSRAPVREGSAKGEKVGWHWIKYWFEWIRALAQRSYKEGKHLFRTLSDKKVLENMFGP